MMQPIDKIRLSAVNLDQAFALLFSAVRGADESTREKINYSELKEAYMKFQAWLAVVDSENNFLGESEHDEIVSAYYNSLLQLTDSA